MLSCLNNCCYLFENMFYFLRWNVFYWEFKSIQSLKQQTFSVQQRESNQMLFVTLCIYCQTLATKFLTLLLYISKVFSTYIKIFVTFHFNCTKINEQDAKTKFFTWFLRCLQLRYFGTLRHQDMHCEALINIYAHNQPARLEILHGHL